MAVQLAQIVAIVSVAKGNYMKTLPSMSGLLPAQFKSDLASIGIGCDTINPKREKEDKELDIPEDMLKQIAARVKLREEILQIA